LFLPYRVYLAFTWLGASGKFGEAVMTKEITKSVVDSAVASEKIFILWDSKTPGFGLAVYPTGVKSFVFGFRTPEGKK
jgi:hypothetical protein